MENNKIIITKGKKTTTFETLSFVAANTYTYKYIKQQKIGSSFSSFLNISYANYPIPNFQVNKIQAVQLMYQL